MPRLVVGVAVDRSFPQSVAALRAELDRLRAELARSDSAGNRRAALKILGQMIATQKAFMSRWPTRETPRPEMPPPPPPGLDGARSRS